MDGVYGRLNSRLTPKGPAAQQPRRPQKRPRRTPLSDPDDIGARDFEKAPDAAPDGAGSVALLATQGPAIHTPESSVVDDANVDEIGEEALPPDTLVAIQLMRAEFPRAEAVATRPFVLRSQLYSGVADRTLVDRQLEELKAKNVVRLFKLATTKDDYAVMLVEDYAAQIEVERRRMEGGPAAPHVAAALAAFVDHVLPSTSAAGISQAELARLLGRGGLAVGEHHISALIHASFLVRQLADQAAYWFSIPNVGRALKSLVQARPKS